jgi:site-specific DNA-methyltransferase (adenine-specific)
VIESLSNRVTLYLGDCREILATLPRVEAVVTDPPYGVEGGQGGQNNDYLKANYDGTWTDDPVYIKEVCAPAISSCVDLADCVALTPGTRCIFSYPQPDDMGCFWSPAAPRRGRFGFAVFHPILYYGKNWLAGRAQSPAGIVLTEVAEQNGHPCPKPIRAWSWLVEKMCPPDGTVLDPFMGSGTTGVAAVRLGRKFIGIEIEQKYFDIARRRLSEALKQGDLFVEKPKAAKQDAML